MEDLFNGHSVFQRHLDYSKYLEIFIKSPKHRFPVMVFAQLKFYSIAFIVKITQKKSGWKKHFIWEIFSKQMYQNYAKIWSFWEWNARRWLWRRKSACFSSEIRTAFQAISWNFIIAWWYAENELTSVLRALITMSGQ